MASKVNSKQNTQFEYIMEFTNTSPKHANFVKNALIDVLNGKKWIRQLALASSTCNSNEKDFIPYKIPDNDNEVLSPFIKAAKEGDIENVKKLMYDNIGTRDCKCKRTALMWAAVYDHPEIVKLLIPYEHGLKTDDGKTALMLAARFDNEECVKLLIPYERRLQDDNGFTALLWAIPGPSIQSIKLLFNLEYDIVDSLNNNVFDYANVYHGFCHSALYWYDEYDTLKDLVKMDDKDYNIFNKFIKKEDKKYNIYKNLRKMEDNEPPIKKTNL